MAVEMQGRGPLEQLEYYVRGQAASLREYLRRGLVTTLLSGLAGLLGIALRGVDYHMIMQWLRLAQIERGVRLRHASNIRLGRGVYLDEGTYLHATPAGIEIGDNTMVMHHAELHVFNFRDLPHAFIKVGRDTFIGESVVIRG